MLDSQVSMTQRGEKDERKSSSAKLGLTYSGTWWLAYGFRAARRYYLKSPK